MPVYEYRCETCDHRFETLVMGAEEVTCPACGSTALAKQVSSFGLGGSGTSPARRRPWRGG